jgi:hypothetical protein
MRDELIDFAIWFAEEIRGDNGMTLEDVESCVDEWIARDETS